MPALIGMWALAGFYLSLGPSLAVQLLHSKNLLSGGILIFLLTGLGAAASAVLAETNPSGVMLGGCLALIAGALVTFAAIETSTAAVWQHRPTLEVLELAADGGDAQVPDGKADAGMSRVHDPGPGGYQRDVSRHS